MSKSEHPVDLLTALARLLSNAALREAFARDAEKVATELGLAAADRATFLQLKSGALERQARVLVRKRFDAIRGQIPATTSMLGGDAWARFQTYARTAWPPTNRSDALHFLIFLEKERLPFDAMETNHLMFLGTNEGFCFRLVRQRGFGWPVLQLLLRLGRRIHDWRFCLKL